MGHVFGYDIEFILFREMKIAYIDAQNIHKWVLLLGRTIDWLKLKEYLEKKYDIDEVQIFFWYIAQYQKFYDMLKRNWYVLIFKEVSRNAQWEVKGNVDIDIAIKAMNDIIDNKLSEAYLLTSDVDFNSLIYEFRRRWIWKGLFVSTMNRTSKYLRKASWSVIHPLSDLKHLIKH